MRATYFWTAVGFAPPILLALFCFGVIGLALASLSRWASGSSPPEPKPPQETPETAFLAPDRRQARAWVPIGATHEPRDPRVGRWIKAAEKEELERAARAVWSTPDVAGRDFARIQALEEWCQGGCVDMGVEIDGGVYFNVSMMGGPEIELREQNSIRDAIDRVRNDPAFFPVLLDTVQRKEI